MIAILIGLTVYCLLAMRIGAWLFPLPLLLEILYYIVAGLLWLYPVMWALKIIERNNNPTEGDNQ